MGWGFIAFLFSILMFQEGLAGVVVEQVMRDREGNASKVFLYFSENKFRTDHPDGSMTTIIDFQGDRMVMIDHQSKHYVEIKFSAVGEGGCGENQEIYPKHKANIKEDHREGNW